MIGEVGHPQRGLSIVAVEYSSWPISALLKGGHFQLTSPVHSSRPLFMVLFPLPATHPHTHTYVKYIFIYKMCEAEWGIRNLNNYVCPVAFPAILHHPFIPFHIRDLDDEQSGQGRLKKSSAWIMFIIFVVMGIWSNSHCCWQSLLAQRDTIDWQTVIHRLLDPSPTHGLVILLSFGVEAPQ